MPPIGSCGVIVEALDEMGDYGVDFADFPCPHPPGQHWYAHHRWLIPLDAYRESQVQRQAQAA
jgi:hypothetical protein